MKVKYPPKTNYVLNCMGVVAILAIYALSMGTSRSNTQSCADGLPFLGIGLGYNQYTVDQLLALSGNNRCQLPLVYNWSAGPSSQLPTNMPQLDFPERFVPMLYGCSDSGITDVEVELRARNYSGPLLLFNEPDRQDQSNCDPDHAAQVLNRVANFRDTYKLETGNQLQLIVGGVGDPENGMAWMNAFLTAYQSTYQLHPFRDYIADSVHFHLYPKYAYDNGAQAFEDVFEQMQRWTEWLSEHDISAWVTEVGVLNAPNQPLPNSEYKKFLSKIIPFLLAHPGVDHAFIFTLNSQRGTTSEKFVKSTLIIDGQETVSYEYVQSICSDSERAFCALPISKRFINTFVPKGELNNFESSSGILSVIGARTSVPKLRAMPAFTRPSSYSYAIGYQARLLNQTETGN